MTESTTDNNQPIVPHILFDEQGGITTGGMELIDSLDWAKVPVAVDTETAKLYGHITLLQVYQAHWDEVVLIRNPSIGLVVYTLTVMDRDASDIVFHNASYDLSVVERTITRWCPQRAELQDTLYLSRLTYPRQQKFSLDQCYIYALGYNPYREAGITKKEMQALDWSVGELTPKQLHYACLDVYHLLDLYEATKAQQGSNSYRLDMRCLMDCLKWQGNGVPLSLEAIDEEIQKTKELIQDAYNPHNNSGVYLPSDLNVNSYQQVRAFLGSTESDKLYLRSEALRGNAEAGLISDVRGWRKTLSFLNTYKAYAVTEGRVSGIFAPSARSGRLTCKNENLQQWPRHLKHLIEAPEGRRLVYSDFDALEMRCIAAMIGDPDLLTILRTGQSPHDYVAARIFGADFTPLQRQVSKTLNFLLLYGGGAAMLQSSLIMEVQLLVSVQEAMTYKKQWLDVFRGIGEWHESGFDAHRAKEVWTTPLGRRYLGNLGTDQLNILVQGMGAEVAKLARVYAATEIEEQGLDVLMCSFKHDDYLYECDDDPEVYMALAKIVGDAMSRAWQTVCGTTRVPYAVNMPIEVDVGTNLKTIDSSGSIHRYSTVGGVLNV